VAEAALFLDRGRGEDISLGKLVPFLGGCVVIVALNLYCFIVRHD
jgi:hypothetical protein